MNGTIKNTNISEYDKMVQLHKSAIELRGLKPTLALEAVEQAFEIATRLNDATYLYRTRQMIGIVETVLGNNERALKMFKAAIKIVRLHFPDDKDALSRIFNGMSMVYSNMGNSELEIDCILRALQLDKNNIYAYGNIAILYFGMKQYNKALDAWQNILDRSKDEESMHLRGATMYNMSHAYTLMGDTQKAKKMLLELFDFIPLIPPEQKNEGLKASALSGLGIVYRDLGDTNKALDYFNQALQIAESESFIQICCETLGRIAGVYFKNNNETKGLSATQKALQYTLGQNLPEQRRQILDKVIEYYEQKNELQKAYPYQKQLSELLEEQLVESRDKNLPKIVAEREKEIQLLEEKNNEIQEQNAILKQFAYIISHDLREPIRGITSFANMLNNKYSEKLDETGIEYLDFILSEAHSMNRNLARLLQYTTVEKNADNIKEIDLQRTITEIQGQYQDESFQLNISFEGVPIKMQRQHAILLLSELIDNAVQFRKEGEDCSIEIKHVLKDENYQLSVKDYGIGIAPAYHSKIFKIFNKINKWEGTGAGVGLAICERIVQLYKGEISVESNSNQFTTFHIKITA